SPLLVAHRTPVPRTVTRSNAVVGQQLTVPGPAVVASAPRIARSWHDEGTDERGARPMRVLDTFLDAMGNTPLVRLHAVTAGLEPTILAKLEMLNPGGSVKDRIGVR